MLFSGHSEVDVALLLVFERKFGVCFAQRNNRWKLCLRKSLFLIRFCRSVGNAVMLIITVYACADVGVCYSRMRFVY